MIGNINPFLLLGIGIFLLIALVGYIFVFIFVSGSKPSGGNYDKFVHETCSSKTPFIKTVLTFGYFKRTFKQFYQHYKLKLFPVPKAQLGKACPDAKLVTLNGEMKSLLANYVNVNPEIPLILNMGSYT